MEIIAVLSDISLANDNINKIEQICVEANGASDRNDTKELLNMVKKLSRESFKTLPSLVNKRNFLIC